MKSSTPASVAIAAAVIRLSPVTITVRMPIRRNAAKRSRMSGLTMSFSSITPISRPFWVTARGVPPERAMRSTAWAKAAGGEAAAVSFSIESTAPFRQEFPP